MLAGDNWLNSQYHGETGSLFSQPDYGKTGNCAHVHPVVISLASLCLDSGPGWTITG